MSLTEVRYDAVFIKSIYEELTMSLLEEIQRDTVDSNADLGMILRKCKILAARLGSEPLENWLSRESNGYSEGAQVPDYRIWSLEVKGHFCGSFGSAMNNVSVPHVCLPEDAKEPYERYQCRMSIGTIEEALRQKPDGPIQVTTSDLAVALGMNVYQGYNCVQAWAEFGTSNLVELLNIVRNRILDFCLAIWKRYPEAGESRDNPDSRVEPTAVTQIFNTTVYGGPANVIGAAHGSSVVLGVTVNDLGSLKAALQENGLQPTDIEELSEALAADGPPTEKSTFGPRVSSWVGKMMQKAADGGWKVGVSAAGGLLAQALAQYYGL